MKKYLLPILLSLFVVVFFSCAKSNTKSSKTLTTEEFIKYSVNGTDYHFEIPADSVFADSLVESPFFFPLTKFMQTGSQVLQLILPG